MEGGASLGADAGKEQRRAIEVAVTQLRAGGTGGARRCQALPEWKETLKPCPAHDSQQYAHPVLRA